MNELESFSRRAWSRSRQTKTVAIGAALVIVGFGAHGLIHRPSDSTTARPLADSPPGTFRATQQQLKAFAVEQVTLHGFASEELTDGKIAVDADRATPVYSPYSGRVIRVVAKLGDTVRAGAPLASIEASEYAQAQSDLANAAAQLKIARISEGRKHALYDSKGGSLQDWQQAQAELAAAENGIGLVRNRLRILGKSDDEIAAFEAARSMNSTAVLAAPIAGVVVDRQIGVGQFLQSSGAAPLFMIADPTVVCMLANVREADAAQVRVGQAVEVHVLAYPNRAFRARVSYVAAIVDPTTHRLPVRAEIDNHDGALKPEMFASFRILTGDSMTAPAVPASAVVYEGDLAHVWVLSAGGLLIYRLIHPGRSNDGLVEVLDGLKAGESIVTRGSLFIDQAAVPAAS